MSILKLKYKAHKFINYAFYIIVFVVGFLLGFASEKINYNKLISQVLMIDNVSAYTIDTYNGYIFDEEFIYNSFKNHWSNFNLDEASYIACTKFTNPAWTCFAYVNDLVANAISSDIESLKFSGWQGGKIVAYRFTFYPNNGTYTYAEDGGTSYFNKNSITNFDNFTQHNPNLTYDYSSRNLLDFSGVGVTLEFNENLFKDNPDFKEVCVNRNDKFLITPVDYGENNDIYTTDFIWFPYKINGFFGSSIDNDNIIGENSSDEYRFYFDSKEAINEEFTENGLQYLLSIVSYYSYENRYSYYGWSAHPFNLYYNQNNDNLYSIPYFYFDNPVMYNLDGTKYGNYESLPFDEYFSYSDENICFYIRNKFNVDIMNKDLNDMDFIDVTLPGGSIHITEDNFNFSSGLFTSITKFINEVSDCLELIKTNVYNFYISMPYLLRLFIVSVFTVLIVKFIIGMVVK